MEYLSDVPSHLALEKPLGKPWDDYLVRDHGYDCVCCRLLRPVPYSVLLHLHHYHHHRHHGLCAAPLVPQTQLSSMICNDESHYVIPLLALHTSQFCLSPCHGNLRTQVQQVRGCSQLDVQTNDWRRNKELLPLQDIGRDVRSYHSFSLEFSWSCDDSYLVVESSILEQYRDFDCGNETIEYNYVPPETLLLLLLPGGREMSPTC